MKLTDFYLDRFDNLYSNDIVRNGVIGLSETYGIVNVKNEKVLFRRTLISLLEEAEQTLDLVFSEFFLKDSKLLEVGGGVGLLYGYLKNLGINITSIEPDAGGFITYNIGKEILKAIKVNDKDWMPFYLDELLLISNKKFEYIVSNNVLEHVFDLDKLFKDMYKILEKNGSMIHSCPNYLIPYECHYKTLLIPFIPRYTNVFNRDLTGDLFNSINFITSFKLRKICRKNGFKTRFHKVDIFDKFENDEEFRRRQHKLIPLYKFLKKTGLINLIKLVNPMFMTPMKVIIWKK